MNRGKLVNVWAHILIANVRTESCHVIEFDDANAGDFSAAESRRYFDTTELKRQGR